MDLLYLGAWLIFTIALLGLTLARSHPYRFPRFLAFESILSLIFLNAEAWFVNPLSYSQILSWLFLAISIYLAAAGFYLIKTRGNPAGDFEDTTALITSGVYQSIRHPLYASLVFFALGAFLKDPSWLGAVLFLSTALGAWLTAGIEEKFNLERFGQPYRDYMDRTKRFIPYIF